MSTQPVFTKSSAADIVGSLDFSSDLVQGETIASVVSTNLRPSNSPLPLVLIQDAIQPTAVVLRAVGGTDNTTYGITVRVLTSNSRTLEGKIVIQVVNNLYTDIPSQDPNSYQTLLGSIDAGASALASTVFVLPPEFDSIDVSSGCVNWTLLGSDGRVHNSGNGHEYTVVSDTFMKAVQATALVSVPSNTLPTSEGCAYQLRWEFYKDTNSSTSPLYQYENLTVQGTGTIPNGAYTAVEIVGDPIVLKAVLPKAFDSVAVEVFQYNNKLMSIPATSAPLRVASGCLYQIDITGSGVSLPASLDAYTVIWKYSSVNNPEIFRSTAHLYVTSATILSAVEDCKARVSKARTTLLGFDDTLFDTETLLTGLRRGKDDFNAAGGYITGFDMTEATGAIRSYWLAFSEVFLLRAQALAEGEKAFNFSGQAISLEVDRTQYYSSLADTLSSNLESQVRPFKANLMMKGIQGGSGNMDHGIGFNRGRIAVGITPASSSLIGVYAVGSRRI